MEIHLFILWSKSYYERKKILSDIDRKFTTLDIYNISWKKNNFSENLSRLYGENLPKNSNKEKHCGNGTFTCVIVRDENPLYKPRQTSKGIRIVNINLFDAKKLYRSWTGGGHKIHATDNIQETRIQLMLLLKKKYDTYLTFNETYVIEKEYNKNLIGCDGWKSLEEVFDVLNLTVNYVILRNFENIHDEIDSLHPDIDILTDNKDNAISILNAQKTYKRKYRVQYKVLINNKNINFDLRFTGDNYYDINWQKNILSTRIKEDFYFRPTEVNYFYSLLYHALLHKAKFGFDYEVRLLEINDNCGFISSRKYFSVEEIFNELEKFINTNKYCFTYPNDFSVYWNYKLYSKVNSSWNISHKIYRVYKSVLQFVGNTKKSIVGWLIQFTRRISFLFVHHFKIIKKLRALNVSVIRILQFNNWHNGFAYYSGIFNGNIVFIKISTKHFFLENEQIFYNLFKDDLSLIKIFNLTEDRNIQILISEFSKEKELTEQDILDNPDILLQIFDILKIINSKGCIHRDVRLNNFLISDDKVRIIDFTFSTCLNKSSRFNDLSLHKKEEEVTLRNLGGVFKPNTFHWNDFYSMDLVLYKLLSNEMSSVKRVEIIKYQELFRKYNLVNNYIVLK
tara:strand:- start:1075 stop:2940 length:1866 start_codon:yes stop_codon:yes gene_type:complete